jgi:hypothetical protein
MRAVNQDGKAPCAHKLLCSFMDALQINLLLVVVVANKTLDLHFL